MLSRTWVWSITISALFCLRTTPGIAPGKGVAGCAQLLR